MTEETERARCSLLIQEAIDFAKRYPQRKDLKNPISKDFQTAIDMMARILGYIKADIDNGNWPRTKQEFDLAEISFAQELMEKMND